jgi:hypothetical protein
MVQGEYHFGVICHASYDVVSRLIARFDRVDLWASGVVSCCVLEGPADPTVPGCTRRCVLKQSGAVWRETLIACSATPGRTFLTAQMAEAHAIARRAPTVQHRHEEFLRGLRGEGPAAAPVAASTAGGPMTDAYSTLSAWPIHDHPLKSFVQFHATFDVRAEEEVEEARRFFSDAWGRRLVECLGDYALHVEFPDDMLRSKAPHLEDYDDLIVDIAAKAPQWQERSERLLRSYCVLHTDLAKAEKLNDCLRHELQGRTLINEQLSRQIADLESKCRAADLKALLAEHHEGQSTAVAAVEPQQTQRDAEGAQRTPEPVAAIQPQQESVSATPPPPPPVTISPSRLRQSENSTTATTPGRLAVSASGDDTEFRKQFDQIREGSTVPFEKVVDLFEQQLATTPLDLLCRSPRGTRGAGSTTASATSTTTTSNGNTSSAAANPKRTAAETDARRWYWRTVSHGPVRPLTFDEYAMLLLFIRRL